MRLRLVIRAAFGLAAAGLVGGLVLGAGGGSLHAQARGAAPTFSKDVAPILYSHCVGCHRPGEMAPMSLLSYDNVRPYGRAIGQKVADGTMPPWHAESPLGMFKNDPRLNDAEKATIAAWVAGGFVQGDPKDLPKAPEFAQGWSIGKPDLVLSMNAPFEVPATGTVAYQNFVIPTNFTEDKWVQAVEVRAGSPSVVHHVLVYSREPDTTPATGAVSQRTAGVSSRADRGSGRTGRESRSGRRIGGSSCRRGTGGGRLHRLPDRPDRPQRLARHSAPRAALSHRGRGVIVRHAGAAHEPAEV